MAISKVVVVDGNNLIVQIDRGVAGRGVTNVQPVEINNSLYLVFTFSDGTTQTVGPVGTIQYIGQSPIVVTDSTISLSTVPVNLGGTGATTASGARTNLAAAASATTISAGTGLSGGGDLTANRTLSIANTGVTAASYGSASKTLTATVNAQGQLTVLADTNIAITNTQVSGLGTASTLNAGVALGVATLDSGGTVPLSQIPASIQGGVSYQGTWNASTNTPTLTSSVGSKGYYYVVSVAGSTNLNGITSWNIGDWAIFNGTAWEKIDNTDAVTSVNGYTGTVVLTNTDITGFGTMSTQNANNVSITGGSVTGITDLAIADGGTGQSTAAAAITALTGTQVAGRYLRSDGTNAALSAIQAADVPTLNQNTTGTAAGLSATLAIASGGTGQTTANTAFNALAPSQTGNSGKYLTTDGSNTSWATNPLGTVTSVDVSGGTTGLTTSGGPVTTSGTITLAGTLATTNGGTGLTSFTANGVVYASSTSALATGTALTFNGSTLATLNANASFTSGSSSTAGVITSGAAGSQGVIQFGSSQTTYNIQGGPDYLGMIYNVGSSTYQHIWQLAGSEQMRLTSTGLRLGTTASLGVSDKLTVVGGNLAVQRTSGITTLLGDNTQRGYVGTTSNNTFSILTNSNEVALFDSSGNLGLGVTPNNWFASRRAISIYNGASFVGVSDGGAEIWGNAYLNTAGDSIYIQSAGAALYQVNRGANGTHAWLQAPSGTAGTTITFTQAMTLNASGNLLVGTTSQYGSAKVTVSSSATDGLVVTQGTAGGFCYLANALSNGGTYYYHAFTANGTLTGTITSNGTTTTYAVTSDQRLKENIVDAPEFGSVIDSFQVRSFDWKANGNHQRAGFVAQELVTIAPEAVHQPADPEEMMAVDYSKLVPMLVKEIQSLRTRLAALEAK